MIIEVAIGRLVLDGIPLTGAEGRIVSDAVTARLTQLLAGDGDGPRPVGNARARVTGGTVAAADADPGLLGRQIAEAVYPGLRRAVEGRA
jgi:hypothetical protein